MGVSSVNKLSQALGTVSEIPEKKTFYEEQNRENNSTNPTGEQSNALVYTDSSTFLKVCLNYCMKYASPGGQ